MERPAKRPRIGSFLHDDEDADDELFLDPQEINAQRDPAVLLEQSRAVATFKLKSRWENVFEKYEKDFTGADDIINFYTEELPEVEVDNGHLRSLADADDAKSVAASELADLDEEERILHGKGTAGGQLIRSRPSSLPSRPVYGGRLSGLASLAPGPPRLSTMFSSGLKLPSFSSFGPLKTSSETLEPIWNAPELPAEAFNKHAIVPTVTKRRVAVKTLVAAKDDGSDDDDIIMGNTSSWMRDKGNGSGQSAPPRVTTKGFSPAVARAPPKARPEPPHFLEISSDAQETLNPPERRKPGRPRKDPTLNSSAEKATLKIRSEATVISDSDTEPLEASPDVEDDVHRLNDTNNDTSSAEPSFGSANSMVRIEVQLLRRRRRPDIVPVPAVSNTPFLGSPARGRKPSLEVSSALVVRAKPSFQKRRTLTLPLIPTPSEDQRDNSRRHTLPGARSAQRGTPAKSSPAKSLRKVGMVLETRNKPVCAVPEQAQAAREPATKSTAPIEQFSRNAIDKDYYFSDEDQSWVPPSRVTKSANLPKKPSPTSRRALVKRVPKTSAFFGSSPSIRTAFPAVKKGFRTGSAKVPEETSARRPELTEIRSDEVSTRITQGVVGVDLSVVKDPKGLKHPPQRANELLSSPVDARRQPQTNYLPITPSSHQSKGKLVPAAAEFVTPSSRQPKFKSTRIPSATIHSSSKRSILSLLSDSDEDELSLSLERISPLVKSVPNQHPVLSIKDHSAAEKSSTKRMSLGSYARATPKQRRSPLSGGWQSASTTKATHRTSDIVDHGDVHRTPGGTLRRCGEDGFKCERDFCFACL